MIRDELVLGGLAHAGQGVVGTLQLLVVYTFQRRLHLLLHDLVVFGLQKWVEWIVLEGTAATDACGLDVLALGVEWREVLGLALAEVAGGLLLFGTETVVVFDDLVEKGTKDLKVDRLVLE